MKTELLAAAAMLAVACGGAQKKAAAPSYTDFECKERRASYISTGGLSGKQGIRMTCDGNVPRVEQFFETDAGQEKKRTGVISAAVWNKSWENFENAGWRNLHDCENNDAGDRDAFHDFEIADGEFQSNFQCHGSALPFPYDTVQQALDSAAGELPADPSAE